MDATTLLTEYGGDTALVILTVSAITELIKRKLPAVHNKYGDLFSFLGGFLLYLVYALFLQKTDALSGSVTAGACTQVIRNFLSRASTRTDLSEARLLTATGILMHYLPYQRALAFSRTLIARIDSATEEKKLSVAEETLASTLTLTQRQRVNLACILLAALQKEE